MHATETATGLNGDLPSDLIEQTVTNLIAAADQARAKRDVLKEAYDEANDLCTRLDRAVRDLTAPKKEYKPRSAAEHKKVRGAKGGTPKTQYDDPNFAPGQPKVSLERQEQILEALKEMHTTAGSRELADATGQSRQTVTSALAHLRHRGLIRFAGKKTGMGGGFLWAPWDGEGDPEDAE